MLERLSETVNVRMMKPPLAGWHLGPAMQPASERAREIDGCISVVSQIDAGVDDGGRPVLDGFT